jgi:hypothetical protein
LAPDFGRQDHTTSPSAHISTGFPTAGVRAPQGPCEDAFGAVSLRAPLPLTEASPPCDPARADAVASTASQPPSRDDRDTPLLMGQDGHVYGPNPKFCQSEYLEITNTTPSTARPSSRSRTGHDCRKGSDPAPRVLMRGETTLHSGTESSPSSPCRPDDFTNPVNSRHKLASIIYARLNRCGKLECPHQGFGTTDPRLMTEFTRL